MGNVNGSFQKAWRAIGEVVRVVLHNPRPWSILGLTWGAISLGLSLVPLGGLALTILTPAFHGGVLTRVSSYLEGDVPHSPHLFTAFSKQGLRGRLLWVGVWTIIFEFCIAIAAIGLAYLPLFGGFGLDLTFYNLPGMPEGLFLFSFGLFMFFFIWLFLAIFVAVPLLVFKDFEPVPAIWSGIFAVPRNLLLLLPIVPIAALAFFGPVYGFLAYAWPLLLGLAGPVLVLYQYFFFRTLFPASAPAVPEIHASSSEG